MATELPLKGPSAGQWDEWGFGLSATALVLLVVTAVLAVATSWPAVVNGILAPLLVFLLFLGFGLRFVGLGKFRRETAEGYATLQDLPRYDLRDLATGRIIRSADEPVAEWSKVSWFRTARRFDRYKLSR